MGSFCGYVSISLIVDNIGRKKGQIIAFGTAFFGMLIVGFSQNLIMAGIGLFLSGLGCNTAYNICVFFITETVGGKQR